MSDQLPPAPPPPPEEPNQPPHGQQPPYGQPPYGQQPPPYGQQQPYGHPYGQPAGYPQYPQYPGGRDPYAGLRREPEIQVDVHGLRPQRRWTVLIRLILAIPQVIILYVLLLAGFFVLIVGWFAALFTGRLPAGIRDFLIGILNYQVRVHGYLFLLVDEYPPFAFFDAPDYPIQLDVPEATALNPASVFFRLIIMVPGWIVTSVVTEGWGVIAFFVWVIMLFMGRQPEPVFGATSAMMRYETRFMGFSGMLTPTQPKGLFGEMTGPGAAGEPVGDRCSPTRPLVLSGGARTLLIVIVVLGVIAVIANSVVNSANNSSNNNSSLHTVSQHR